MKIRIMPHGWMAKYTIGRPKARLCVFLSVIWATVATIGVLLLWQPDSSAEVSELYYLGWVLVVPEPVFIALAFFFWLTEQPRKIRAYSGYDGPVIH